MSNSSKMIHITHDTAEKIHDLSLMAAESTFIPPESYSKFDVKRGLRDINGVGVIAGLTEISDIHGFKIDENGQKIPAEGELRYRGIKIEDLIDGIVSENRFGFEEAAYLLLFGRLPNVLELKEFKRILRSFRSLPDSFVRDIIMKAPSGDMMNVLSRCVLVLYSYDKQADDTSIENVLRQCLQLISQFPMLSVYGYRSHRHYHCDESLIIHKPLPKNSIAENILHLLRADSKYTELEAKVLDICLILHAEHGGGNNSSFTMHVVSSTGTDTYSAVAASLGALKGPRHGGANIKVVQMIQDMKNTLKHFDDSSIEQYLCDLLDKKGFDKSGLIYGMGHAVYSLSDPRANILRGFVKKLAEEQNFMKDYQIYEAVERLAPKVIADKRKIYKGVSANIDFYTGFIYSMLGLPEELYTPIFACSRIVGWSAHRIEELSNNNKIIRPGYESVCAHSEYTPLEKR